MIKLIYTNLGLSFFTFCLLFSSCSFEPEPRQNLTDPLYDGAYYTVYFDGNGVEDLGDDSIIGSMEVPVGGRARCIGANLKRSGYLFKGWNSEQDGSGEFYYCGDFYAAEENGAVLYAAWEEDPGPRTIGSGEGAIELQWVPAGAFWMGSAESGDSDESPSHRVRFNQGFWISRYEITQLQWETYAPDENLTLNYGKGDNYPVYNISYDMLIKSGGFFDNLGAISGENVQLPTEAQWEYACRAGTSTSYYWGENMDTDYGIYLRNSSESTVEVGGYLPNNWGLYDMSGNVSELCQDIYSEDFYTQTEGFNPVNLQEDGASSLRVWRGGSWRDDAAYLRSANRHGNSQDKKFADLGLRIVILEEEDSGYQLQGRGEAGGLIFHDKGSYEDGWRYLEVYTDLDESWYNQNWAPFSVLIDQANQAGAGAGLSNTEAIVNQYGTEQLYAASLCYNFGTVGYNDWYLPSREELLLIHENLHCSGLGNFPPQFFWTSTQTDVGNAESVFFNQAADFVPAEGEFRSASKAELFGVLPVRRF